MSWQRLFLVGLATCFAGAALSSTAVRGQSSSDDRVLAAMQQRGLMDGAIRYAQERIRISQNDDMRARWSQRLMECLAQDALRASAPAESLSNHENWQQARRVRDDFAAAAPEHPRLPWLDWQLARCQLLQSQGLLAAYLAAPANASLREQTLVAVRAVLASTEQLSDDLERRIPLAAREGFQNRRLAPVQELHQLALDITLLECEALLVRMRVYESGSPDSVAAATEIESRTNEAANRAAEDWGASELVEAARGLAQLQLGRADRAILTLERLAREGSTRQVQIRAATAAIEWLAAQGDTSRATPLLTLLQSLANDSSPSGGSSPEIELARIQLAVADLKTTPEERRQTQVVQLVDDARQLGERFGEYWRNRAEAILVGNAASGESSPELMMVEVRQLLASGDTARAVKRLLEFRDIEANAARGANAVMLGMQAAALLQQQAQWQPSVAAIEPVVLQFSETPAAPRAHRLLVWAHIQLMRQQPSPDLTTRYESVLQRQLAIWPDAEESDEVLQWLTSWWVGQNRRPELLSSLAKRGVATKRMDVAVRSLTEWLEQLFWLESNQRSKAIEELVAIIAASQSATGETAKLPEAAAIKISNDEGKPQLQVARLTTLFAETVADWPLAARGEELERELASWMRESHNQLAGTSDPTLKDFVQAQVAALRSVLALRRLDESVLQDDTHRAWHSFAWPPAVRRELITALVAGLDELPADRQARWLSCLPNGDEWLESLAASPQWVHRGLEQRCRGWRDGISEPLERLQQWVTQQPTDGALRLTLAHMHASRGSQGLDDSTRVARFVVANSPAGSSLNLAARWRICKNELWQGNESTAVELSRLLLASQPLPASLWAERFQRLAGGN